MFKFRRTFATDEVMNKIEKSINEAKTKDEALAVIPCDYPDYICEEIKKDIESYFIKNKTE